MFLIQTVGNGFKLVFTLCLHKDEIPFLKYLAQRLGVGFISVREKSVSYTVSSFVEFSCTFYSLHTVKIRIYKRVAKLPAPKIKYLESKSRSLYNSPQPQFSIKRFKGNLTSSPYFLSRFYTTNTTQLDPWFLTGYADAEGCFNVCIYKKGSVKIGWTVQPLFIIVLHKKDIAILEIIKSTMGVGEIYKHGKNAAQFRIFSIKDLAVVINHFDKYPLITKKLADYILFKRIIGLISNKEHLTMEGLQKIIAIKTSMNLGLSDELKKAFPNIIPVKRPLVRS